MILGRNPALWLSLVTAALNAGIALGILHLTTDQLAQVDTLAVAIIGIVANSADRSTAPTFALTTKAPGQTG